MKYELKDRECNLFYGCELLTEHVFSKNSHNFFHGKVTNSSMSRNVNNYLFNCFYAVLQLTVNTIESIPVLYSSFHLTNRASWLIVNILLYYILAIFSNRKKTNLCSLNALRIVSGKLMDKYSGCSRFNALYVRCRMRI